MIERSFIRDGWVKDATGTPMTSMLTHTCTEVMTYELEVVRFLQGHKSTSGAFSNASSNTKVWRQMALQAQIVMRILAILAIAFLLPIATFADETITFTTTANTHGNLFGSGNYGYARAFTPSATADSGTIHATVNKVGSPTGSVQVKIIGDSSGSPDVGTVIVTESVDVSSLGTNASDVIDVPFTASLTSGTKYWVYINRSTLTSDGSNYVRVYQWDNGVDNNVDFLETNDGSSFHNDNEDLTGSIDLVTGGGGGGGGGDGSSTPTTTEAACGTSTSSPCFISGIGDVVFGQGIIIVLLFLVFIAFMFNGLGGSKRRK